MRDLKHLKELSWFLTVPFLVCAIAIDTGALEGDRTLSLWSIVVSVGPIFFGVVATLMILFVLFLWLLDSLDSDGKPFTLALASFLLSLAAIGAYIFVAGGENGVWPVSEVWILVFASLAFNLFEIREIACKAAAKAEKKDGDT